MNSTSEQRFSEANRVISDAEIAAGALLLHACCAPCACWPVEDLRARGIEPQLYYYNPNIHPFTEWQRRFEALEDYCAFNQLRLSYSREWDEEAWRRMGRTEARCRFCYGIRMRAVAEEAAALGFRYFTTTLLVSPYQNREMILQSGRAAAKAYGLVFLEEDWRERFRYGQQLAREAGLYRQKYCACCLSLEDSDFREKITADQEHFVARPSSPKREEMLPLKR